MSKAVCVNCRRAIDASARACPYCGANPTTGERIDTQALMEEVFKPRQVSKGESVLEFARQRQGIVIVLSLFGALLLVTAFHQYASMRNRTAVTAAPAVALTDVADLSNQPVEAKQLPMPQIGLQFDGQPQSMRTFVMEPGAVVPPDVVAAQQAAQQAAAQAAQEKAAAQQAAAQAAQAKAAAQHPGVASPAPAAGAQPVARKTAPPPPAPRH